MPDRMRSYVKILQLLSGSFYIGNFVCSHSVASASHPKHHTSLTEVHLHTLVNYGRPGMYMYASHLLPDVLEHARDIDRKRKHKPRGAFPDLEADVTRTHGRVA